MEARLLILKNGIWIAANYQWNENQQDAALIDNGAGMSINFSIEEGRHRRITYKFPLNKTVAVAIVQATSSFPSALKSITSISASHEMVKQKINFYTYRRKGC